MIDIAERYGLHTLQLHGMEAPELCKSLKYHGLKVIKVIPGDQIENTQLIEEYREVSDYLLFDTPTRAHGGSGRKFNWSNLEKLEFPNPFFLSGGIGPGDSGKLLELANVSLFAVDINSRFEIEPGIKDISATGKFINEIRQE